jgi:hypothetical protein
MTLKQRMLLPLMLIGLFVAGCTSGTLTAASLLDFNPFDYFSGPVNMKEKNYATADYLIDRAKHYMKPGDKIKAMPLLDVQEPRLITRFGKQVPEQIGERLGQLGYNVDLSAVSTDANPAFAAAPQPVTNSPKFILSGSYLRRTSSTLDMRLYIKDAATGFERGSFDYTLRRTGDIRKNSEPKPMIYKTQ